MTQLYANYISETVGRLNESKSIKIKDPAAAAAYVYCRMTAEDVWPDENEWDETTPREAKKELKKFERKVKMSKSDIDKLFDVYRSSMSQGYSEYEDEFDSRDLEKFEEEMEELNMEGGPW